MLNLKCILFSVIPATAKTDNSCDIRNNRFPQDAVDMLTEDFHEANQIVGIVHYLFAKKKHRIKILFRSLYHYEIL